MVLGPISLCGALLLGLALLWAVRLTYGGRETPSDDVMRLVLTIAGWIMIHIGVLSAAAQVVFVVPDPTIGLAPWLGSMILGAIFLSPIALGIFGMAVARYRALEWTSLMWLLAAAAAHEIPLAKAVRSFARERTDEVGLRAARLADLLDQGVSLPAALEQSRTWLPIEGVLAARLGTETGELRSAISAITRNNEEVHVLVRSTIERGFYLGVVGLVILSLVWVAGIQLFGVFSNLFDEFGVEPSPITEALFSVGDAFSTSLTFFLPLAFIGWLLAICVGVGCYIGWLPRDIPGFYLLTKRYDAALIMRTLASAVQQGGAINRVVWMLARVYPRGAVRRKLRYAGERINNGEPWFESLRRQGLITATDAGVFRSAQQVGNLEWALNEMAESTLRRIVYRLVFWLNVLFPLVLLAIGALVGFIVIGLFEPLVRLIESVA